MFFVLYGAVILKISSTAPFLPREIAFTTFKMEHKWGQARSTKLTIVNYCCKFCLFQLIHTAAKKGNIFQMTYNWLSKPWEPAGKARVVWSSAGFVWLSWQWHLELHSVEPSLQTFCLDKHIWNTYEHMKNILIFSVTWHKINRKRK